MAVALSGTQFLERTANLPDDVSFTLCGWAIIPSDINAEQSLGFLESATQGIGIAVNIDGTTLEINSDAGSGTIAALTMGLPFFWGITSSGLGSAANIGYYRSASQKVFTTANPTGTRAAQTPDTLTCGDFRFTGDGPLSGRLWNVKCWDRALTAAELLVESYYRRVMFPSSINFHWPLANASSTSDISGNGRNPTVGGTLTTEDGSHGLWVPQKRISLVSNIAWPPPTPATQIPFTGLIPRRRRYPI